MQTSNYDYSLLCKYYLLNLDIKNDKNLRSPNEFSYFFEDFLFVKRVIYINCTYNTRLLFRLTKIKYLNVKFVFLFYFFLLGFKVLGQGDISKSVIDSSKNMIQNVQNDKHWILFAQKVHRLKSERKGTITIVQLGDSHIQGGYFTNKVRELLNNQYGVAGRVLVFPYSKVNGFSC